MFRWLLLPLVLPTLAMAEPWTCEMTAECTIEDCTAVVEIHTLIAADHEGQLFLDGPRGSAPVTRLSLAGDDVTSYAALMPRDDRPDDLTTLRILPDGQAQMVNQSFQGPNRVSILYGTCSPI